MKYITLFTSLLIVFLCSCGSGDTNNSSTPASGNVNTAPPKGNNTVPVTPANFVKYTPTYERKAITPDPNRKLENPNITVEVEGLGSGMCHLIGIYTDQFFMADSAMASGGKMVFKKNEPYQPGFYYLRLPDRRTTLQLLIDADQTFKMKTKMNNLNGGMKVEGCIDNELLYQTLKYEGAQQPEFNRINNSLKQVAQGTPEYTRLKAEQEALGKERTAYLQSVFTKNPRTLFTAFKEAGQNPTLDPILNPDGSMDNDRYVNKYKTMFWDNVNFDDERVLYTPVIANKLKRYINELTAQNPDSIKASADHLVGQVLDKKGYFQYFANWIVLNYEPTKTSLMDSEAVFVHMVQNYFTYDRAFWSDSTEVHSLQLRAYEMSQSLIGQKGANVQAADPNGKMRSIYDLKDNYIIVYMWNPDCEHCAEQTPQLVQFYHQWKPKGVDVYAIVVNTEPGPWKEAIKKYNMPWENNVHDPTNRAIYATYFVDNTPEVYVLDPDRNIIGKNLKVDQLSIILERDMKKRGLM